LVCRILGRSGAGPLGWWEPAEKAAADWLYPGAKVVQSSGSSSEVGTVFCVVQETADDVPKILKYYGDKLGIILPEMGSKQAGRPVAG